MSLFDEWAKLIIEPLKDAGYLESWYQDAAQESLPNMQLESNGLVAIK